ncbi:hypothetical protein AWC38_SpisGene11292 [Stylophora pistillata]|uniref:MACPF domain-containing protein n=1 Tax=Stylophora pistillata TaxID=50429 RepID=A0A2B4S6G9_STYPI|nr:hypothetical protein AWC38_SpisGene11292 [Stylophora pistillata]
MTGCFLNRVKGNQCSATGTNGIAACKCNFMEACDAQGNPNPNLAHYLPTDVDHFGLVVGGKQNLAYLCQGVGAVGILYDCNNRIPLYAATVIHGAQLTGKSGGRPRVKFSQSRLLNPSFQQENGDYVRALKRELCYITQLGRNYLVQEDCLKASGRKKRFRTQICPRGSVVKTSVHRGHLIASQYGLTDQAKKRATFTYTKAVPQFGVFNSHPWRVCEGRLIKWGNQNCALVKGATTVRLFVVVGAIPSTKTITLGKQKMKQKAQRFTILYKTFSGVRLDNDLQDCNGTYWKKSYPDLDFALLGYDILQGDPNAECDPGFTHPIFKADYTERRQSADCRYSVPVGLTVYPCQSCLVSFESTLVRNKQEMSKHLGAAAKMEGKRELKFQFARYKRDVAEMSSGEYVRVISSAQCQYYRGHIDLTRPPPFHTSFIEWATKLADPRATDVDVRQFVKYYGTHFFSDVTFGAKFIQSQKIRQAALTTPRKESISVKVQASYSGLFNIGGGFSMDSNQRNAASKFIKNIQTTTITVGSSLPSNGDVMTWAASVQSNPVPTKYTLTGIENLFTDHFTRHLSPKVNYGRLKKRLASAAYKYCQVLKMQGKVSRCKNRYNVEGTDIGFTQKGFKSFLLFCVHNATPF